MKKRKILYETIKEKVNRYPTKYKEGFTQTEVDNLVQEFTDIHMDKFNNALNGITVFTIEGETIYFHGDIQSALLCGLENRDLYIWEWD